MLESQHCQFGVPACSNWWAQCLGHGERAVQTFRVHRPHFLIWMRFRKLWFNVSFLMALVQAGWEHCTVWAVLAMEGSTAKHSWFCTNSHWRSEMGGVLFIIYYLLIIPESFRAVQLDLCATDLHGTQEGIFRGVLRLMLGFCGYTLAVSDSWGCLQLFLWGELYRYIFLKICAPT